MEDEYQLELFVKVIFIFILLYCNNLYFQLPVIIYSNIFEKK